MQKLTAILIASASLFVIAISAHAHSPHGIAPANEAYGEQCNQFYFANPIYIVPGNTTAKVHDNDTEADQFVTVRSLRLPSVNVIVKDEDGAIVETKLLQSGLSVNVIVPAGGSIWIENTSSLPAMGTVTVN